MSILTSTHQHSHSSKPSLAEEITRDLVLGWLEDVKDPEIPVLSLIDLGVITDVQVGTDSVRVEMTPTFVGCPATEYMRSEVHSLLISKGIGSVEVDINFKKPWSSDRITENGKLALRKFGLAPPPPGGLIADIEVLERAVCPRCGQTDTELRSPFGPTLCRAIYYCNTCREAFEQFKPL
jgi:ring-1,2-phenylacetyl-CoA epoxidase subunit PaaD